MKKKLLIPVLIIVVAVVVTGGMMRMRPDPRQNTPTEPVILVETLLLDPADTAITVSSQGNVLPRTSTTLVSEVSGRVTEVSPAFVAGGYFRKGDVLLKLDDSNYRAAVSRNEAAVAGARSALAQEQGQADVAQREYNNMSEAEKARIRAKDLYLRKPQLAEAEARLASAEADLTQARADLAKTTVLAPYDGLVSSKNTDIGQYVNAGTTLGETFAVDYAEVRLPIPETKLAFLDLPPAIAAEDSPASLADTGPLVDLVSRVGNREYHWQGRLARTEGVLDTRSRVMYAVVQVADPYGLYGSQHEQPLHIGTYVNASIEGRVLQDVFQLPRHTLQSGDLVWVADQEDRLRSRQVEVVTVNGDNAYIRGGLLPGDRIVITRLENPLNGSAVQTVTLPEYSAVN